MKAPITPVAHAEWELTGKPSHRRMGEFRGVAGLRVVDASLMPQATAGDLNAPTLALAERMSDLIRGRHLPEAEGADLLADPQWATRQRGPAISRNYANNRSALAAALLANARGEEVPMEATR